MSDAGQITPIERALRLLADRAVERLNARDTRELMQLLDDFPELDESVLDRTAAALDLAFKLPRRPLPEALYSRLLVQGNDTVSAAAETAAVRLESEPEPTSVPEPEPKRARPQESEPSVVKEFGEPPAPPPPPPIVTPAPLDQSAPPAAAPAPSADETLLSSAVVDDDAVFAAPAKKRGRKKTAGQFGSAAWLGWAVAALCAVVAAAGWFGRSQLGGAGASLPDIEQRRTALLQDSQTLRLDWKPADSALAGSGDVTWNRSRQTGFIRLEGLTPNDPDERQYQLWIFDAERDRRYPVSGGIFNVAAGAAPALIAIDADLPIDRPERFTITLEPAGGVVVSDRERIVLTAEP